MAMQGQDMEGNNRITWMEGKWYFLTSMAGPCMDLQACLNLRIPVQPRELLAATVSPNTEIGHCEQ